MERTKKRALVSGLVSNSSALIYAVILGVFGFATLGLFTNTATVLLGALGIVFYVIVYGIAKRTTVHGTVIGSIAGAFPPVAGYTAVTNQVDTTAVLLFLILVFWQMPHFYAIAMYRLKDYSSAGLPVLPVKKGIRATKIQITIYTAAFLLATQAMTLFGSTGYLFQASTALLGVVWLYKALKGFEAPDDTRWAKTMFVFSLGVILGLDIMLAVGARLP